MSSSLKCPEGMYADIDRCCYKGKPTQCFSRLDSKLYARGINYSKMKSLQILPKSVVTNNNFQ